MSHSRVTDETNTKGQIITQNTFNKCLPPTTLKVGAVVLGLLLIGTGLTMYFLHVNTIAARITGNLGGAIILGTMVWSAFNCLRSRSIGARELTLDLSNVEGNPKITEAEVTDLLTNNPNLQKLRIALRPHRLDTHWDPDFKALNSHFKRNVGGSSGSWYIYDRK